jgi:hypothetical protein
MELLQKQDGFVSLRAFLQPVQPFASAVKSSAFFQAAHFALRINDYGCA